MTAVEKFDLGMGKAAVVILLSLMLGGLTGACHEGESADAGILSEDGTEQADVYVIPDDFCHGAADGAPCNDGNVCTSDDRCGLGLCKGRSLAEGADCDDQDLCTIGDTCQVQDGNLQCLGLGVNCSDLDSACGTGACDPLTGLCAESFAEPGTACDDGDGCTVTDVCEVTGLGATCVGQALDCSTLDGPCVTAACDPLAGECKLTWAPLGQPCDDGDLCTNGERCLKDGETTTCVPKSEVKCSSFGNQCQVGQCDPTTGQCVIISEGPADGTSCNDGNKCTVKDQCLEGECTGTPLQLDCSQLDGPCAVGQCDPATGGCVLQTLEDETACEDGNLCTRNGSCLAGTCRSEPLPLDCSHLEGACMLGQCHPATGECAAIPVLDGTNCDDADACTQPDGCFRGQCTGQPKDCSLFGGPCTQGVCESSTGLCGFANRPDGTSCDDQDPCTGNDSCQGGECLGQGQSCSICDELLPGDPCDDQSLCTTNDHCVLADGNKVCLGDAVDCSASSDDCNVGACAPATGTCFKVPKATGLGCFDGDHCTHADSCQNGVCAGLKLPTCGETVTNCEAPQDNSSTATATPVQLEDGKAVILGLVSPSVEVDWYSLELAVGQLLTAETRANCLVEVDTTLELFASDGKTLIVADDDGGNGGNGPFSKLSAVEISSAGTYFLKVTLHTDGISQGYLLDLGAPMKPLCEVDTDCTCPDAFRCEDQGLDAGRCLPRYPSELEPNNGPTVVTPAALEVPVLATLATQSDQDWYGLDLVANEPYSLSTSSLCGEPVDLELAVYDALGQQQLAFDGDSGGGGHALLALWIPGTTGRYLARVRGQNLSTGGYVFLARSARCTEETGCQCQDQVCGEAGLCVAANSAPEGAPVPLALGARTQAAIGAPYDKDDFQVELVAGQVYDFQTLAYCGSAMDSFLTVLDPEAVQVASDDNGGEGFFAAVKGFQPAVSGVFTLRVKANGPGTGQYLVVATEVPAGEAR